METTATTNFKTSKARAYDDTPLGQVYVGTVKITIDLCDLNERSLNSKFVLKDVIQVDEFPTFKLFEDFPADVVLPGFDMQAHIPPASSVPASVPLDLIDSLINESDETDSLPDFQYLDEVHNEFNLTADQVDVYRAGKHKLYYFDLGMEVF